MDTQMQDVSETLNGAVEGATDFLASVVGKKTRRRKKVEAGAAGGKATAKKARSKKLSANAKTTAKRAPRKAAGQTKGERREVRAMGAVVRPKTRLDKVRFVAEGVTLFFKDGRKLTTPLKFLDKRLAKMQPKELKQAVITQRGKCLSWKTAGIEVPIENALHCKLV
ncbi:MAG: hypothetical protein ACRYGR_01650 [Janthinobacterium lividum]